MTEIVYYLFDYSKNSKPQIDKLLNSNCNFINDIQNSYFEKLIKIGFFTSFGNFLDNGTTNLLTFIKNFKNNKDFKDTQNTSVFYGYDF